MRNNDWYFEIDQINIGLTLVIFCISKEFCKDNLHLKEKRTQEKVGIHITMQMYDISNARDDFKKLAACRGEASPFIVSSAWKEL